MIIIIKKKKKTTHAHKEHNKKGKGKKIYLVARYTPMLGKILIILAIAVAAFNPGIQRARACGLHYSSNWRLVFCANNLFDVCVNCNRRSE